MSLYIYLKHKLNAVFEYYLVFFFSTFSIFKLLQPRKQSQTAANLYNCISCLPRCIKTTPYLAVMSPWDNSLLSTPKETSPHGKRRLFYVFWSLIPSCKYARRTDCHCQLLNQPFQTRLRFPLVTLSNWYTSSMLCGQDTIKDNNTNNPGFSMRLFPAPICDKVFTKTQPHRSTALIGAWQALNQKGMRKRLSMIHYRTYINQRQPPFWKMNNKSSCNPLTSDSVIERECWGNPNIILFYFLSFPQFRASPCRDFYFKK